MTKPARRDTLVWGFVLIVLGVIFLLDTLDVEIWDTVSRFWPLVLIFWGGWKLWFGIKERNEVAKAERTGRE